MKRSVRTVTLGLVALGSLATAATAQAPAGSVSVGYTDTKPAPELVKTLPIARHRGHKKRVVLSLSPGQVGDLQSGDRIEVSGQEQVTVCLKHDPDHPGDGLPCIGKVYGYDPNVEAQLVLAHGRSDASGLKTDPLSRVQKLQCSQTHPDRNHHCVLVIRPSDFDITSGADLPCPPTDCRVNLVMDAWHRNAGRRHKVVVGSNDRDNVIHQGEGRLNIVRFRPGDIRPPRPLESHQRETRSIPISPNNKDGEMKVIYSVPIRGGVEKGEKLAMEAMAEVSLGPHPYSALLQGGVYLTDARRKTDGSHTMAVVTGGDAEIGTVTGFNCTQGSSAHRTPCVVRRAGVLQIQHPTNRTLYMNMIVAARTMFPEWKWHRGDRAPITRQGWLRVRRYPPNGG